MKIAIVMKSQTNNCLSALQYTDECHQCDKVFSCKVKSRFHINGVNKMVQYETEKILKANETRINNLKALTEKTLRQITN